MCAGSNPFDRHLVVMGEPIRSLNVQVGNRCYASFLARTNRFLPDEWMRVHAIFYNRVGSVVMVERVSIPRLLVRKMLVMEMKILCDIFIQTCNRMCSK